MYFCLSHLPFPSAGGLNLQNKDYTRRMFNVQSMLLEVPGHHAFIPMSVLFSKSLPNPCFTPVYLGLEYSKYLINMVPEQGPENRDLNPKNSEREVKTSTKLKEMCCQ